MKYGKQNILEFKIQVHSSISSVTDEAWRTAPPIGASTGPEIDLHRFQWKVLARWGIHDVVFPPHQEKLAHTQKAWHMILRLEWPCVTVWTNCHLLVGDNKKCLCSCFSSLKSVGSRWLRRGRRKKWTVWKTRNPRRTEYQNKGEKDWKLTFIFWLKLLLCHKNLCDQMMFSWRS